MDSFKTLSKLKALDQKDFRPSRFTIRVKLLFIITVIVFISLIFMTFTSGSLFKTTSTSLIQEFNLSTARLMGSKVEKEIYDLVFRLSLFSNGEKDSLKRNLDIFYQNNQEIFGISIILYKDQNIVSDFFYPNKKSFLDTPLTENNLEKAILKVNFEDVSRKGLQVELLNLYPYFNYPVVAVLIKNQKENGKYFCVYLNSGSLIQSFLTGRQSDSIELMLVDNEGKLILHSNPEENNHIKDISNSPIVKKMLVAKIDNGSMIYKYKDIQYLGSYFVTSLSGIGVISTVPSDRAFEAVYKIKKQNLILLAITLVTAFIVVFLFARTLSVPVVKLVEVTNQIEKGNFHIDIHPTTTDEIGILTSSFIKMARGLWEKEQIQGAFGKFVNKEIVKKALEGEVKLGGENKNCTVFFSDIRSFTNMSESREPGEVLDILNEYFTKMVDCVHSTEGVVDKFIGDAVMAHWGAMMEVENDSRLAVIAALKMRTSLLELNKDFKKRGKPIIKIGCGINTGPVIAGQIGSEERLEFTVIGDAVNLASRIEYLNKYFGTDILISESCFEKLGEEFICQAMPMVKVKGKEKPQRVYAVLGHKDDKYIPKNLEELREYVGIEFTDESTKNINKTSDKIYKK
ncbi:MAG: HAMP domain-containing protein [Leptospiraceae bacterium]|nr:HAMP domain-containing protein [Leptospiraceae bacterium]